MKRIRMYKEPMSIVGAILLGLAMVMSATAAVVWCVVEYFSKR